MIINQNSPYLDQSNIYQQLNPGQAKELIFFLLEDEENPALKAELDAELTKIFSLSFCNQKILFETPNNLNAKEYLPERKSMIGRATNFTLEQDICLFNLIAIYKFNLGWCKVAYEINKIRNNKLVPHNIFYKTARQCASRARIIYGNNWSITQIMSLKRNY